jgi:hypothetical protein
MEKKSKAKKTPADYGRKYAPKVGPKTLEDVDKEWAARLRYEKLQGKNKNE